MNDGVLARYRAFLPIGPATPMISLCEGSTPLVRAPRIEQRVGCHRLFLKLEGCNPTGSFKDRGMVLAVAKAIEAGNDTIACASTGNTSSSAAAYASRCGLRAIVIVPKGYTALGKLSQALVCGARVLSVEGNFDQALDLVRQMVATYPVALVNSINPFRLEGQKTAAFEVVDDLGDAPDLLCIPVGNAGNITAYWRGFSEYFDAAKARRRPKMMGFQAEGAAPIVRGERVLNPQTIATAIRIGNPASWKGAVAARDASGGQIESVTDDEILDAYKLLAREEGVFAEPASAASVAGLLKLARQSFDLAGKDVVCVLTGNGLKDPDRAIKVAEGVTDIPPDFASVERALGWK